jgi:hypothetical protein
VDYSRAKTTGKIMSLLTARVAQRIEAINQIREDDKRRRKQEKLEELRSVVGDEAAAEHAYELEQREALQDDLDEIIARGLLDNQIEFHLTQSEHQTYTQEKCHLLIQALTKQMQGQLRKAQNVLVSRRQKHIAPILKALEPIKRFRPAYLARKHDMKSDIITAREKLRKLKLRKAKLLKE